MRKRLPDERQGITHHFSVGGVDGYLTIGLYEDSSPGEIFVKFAKEGGRESALLDAWATMVSIALQSGVPIETIVEKFRGWRFEPQGMTSNKDIPMVSSPLDYIARYLGKLFCEQEQ